MTSSILTAARIVAEYRERLTSDHELEDGEDVLETTLQGVSDLPELLACEARKVRWAEAQSEAIGLIIKDYQSRQARLESAAANRRVQIAWAMQESGMKRIPADVLPEMTVSLTAGRAPLLIPNESDVPDQYMRIKTIREPDKKLIRDAIDAGGRFSFAMLGNSRPTLTVRTR